MLYTVFLSVSLVLKKYLSWLGPILFLGVFIFALISPLVLHADTYTDNSNDVVGFGGGTHSDTQWDAVNTWLEMDSTGQTNGFATFTSRILNAGSNAQWDTIAWVPQRPLLKELPDSMSTETAYTEGNMDMSNNNVLLHLNESSGASSFADSSGSSNTGSCSGDTCPTVSSNGRFNNAFTFDGNDDSIELPSQSVSNLIGDQFTIAFWVNPGAVADKPTFGFTNSGGWNDRNPIASYDGVLNIGDGALSTQFMSALPDATANTWTHYAIVDNGTHYVRYVNGVQIASDVITLNPASAGNRIFTIGQSGFDPAFDDHFNGTFDEFAIFKRGLTPTEVLNMYKRGALRLKFQVRSCDDSSCVGENFIGPDGLTTTFYTEFTTSTTSTPSKTIQSLSRNQYFQYRAMFETSSSTLNAELKSVTLANTGAGTSGVTLTQSGGSTTSTEDGVNDTYTVVLDAQPLEDVTLTVSSDAQCSVSTSTILFTSSNWASPVTVSTTAINDSVAEGNHGCTISHSATSGDSDYNGIVISSVTNTITDNDTAGVTITQSGGSTIVTEAGATDSYTLVLTSAPTSTVTVALSVSDSAQISLSTSSVAFTSANWSDAVTVTVTPTNDSIAEGSHGVNVTYAVSSSNWNYNSISVSATAISITDDDTAGVTITESDGTTSVSESGGNDSYTVVLTSAPTSTVTVALTGTSDVTLSTSSLEFNSANWDIAITITVSAVDDATFEGSETATVSQSVTSSNWNYNEIAVNSVSVGIIDNDVAPTSSGSNANNNSSPAPAPAPIPLVQTGSEPISPQVLPLALLPNIPAQFTVGNQSHSLSQIGIATDSQITLLIQSDPIVLTLTKEKAREVDLDNDKKPDVELLYLGKKNGIPQIETKIFGQTNAKFLPFTINQGATTTSLQDVLLSFQVKNVAWMSISEDKNFFSGSFIPFMNQYKWKLSSGFGEKIVYARLLSPAGGMIDLSDTIVYESKIASSTVPFQSKVVFSRFLKKGMKGEDIRALQTILQNLGFMEKAVTTNFFGVLTEQSVKKFQTSVNIDSVGYVGPATRKALNAVK